MIAPFVSNVAGAGWFQVFVLFMVPWGPGPIAGIVRAHRAGLSIGLTVALYVLSDVASAVIVEPIVRVIRARGERSRVGQKILESVSRLGSITRVSDGRLGLPVGLFVFTFATDFFTAALLSVGLPIQRILAWIMIIAGDVLWFLIILLASIGIASFLTDDRILFLVTLVFGLALPPLFRKLFERRREPVPGPR